MKKAYYFLIILFLLSACGRNSNFTISGQLNGGAGKTIYLNKLLISNQLITDSIQLNSSGEFKFKGNASSPTFYLLKLSKNSYVTLLVDSTENVRVNGSYNNFTRDYKISGSTGSEMLRDLDGRFIKAKTQLDSIRVLYNSLKNNPVYATKVEALHSRYNGIATEHSNYVTYFVKRNPFSLASVYALYQKWDESNFVINDLQAMKTAASALYSVYPKNEQVIALYNNTLQFIKEERNKQLVNAVKNNAVNTPNIVLPDADGHSRDLWSLHGKYVLLYFWSAKDRTSRIVNPVLSELYHKFKSRGFEIFMVSVDNDRAAWMEAIASDNLSCINVGDMKGSFQAASNYNIQELPFNYLIDKEGNIIARNLRGPALNQALNQIFK